MLILAGLALITAVTVVTGYFVAQEFTYVAVDRERLRAMATAGDAKTQRALAGTSRLSFMLSGAQLGITVTGLVAGYLAEPFLGRGLDTLIGGVGLPKALTVAVSVGLALLVTTGIQMVLGELAPKNLAIARPSTWRDGVWARATAQVRSPWPGWAPTEEHLICSRLWPRTKRATATSAAHSTSITRPSTTVCTPRWNNLPSCGTKPEIIIAPTAFDDMA